MEIGAGIALGSLCVSVGAVSIAAIRSRKTNSNGSGLPCKDHSGLVACLDGIEKNMERHEQWLAEIAGDVKQLLINKGA